MEELKSIMIQMLTLQKQKEQQLEQQKQQHKLLGWLLDEISKERTSDSFSAPAVANSVNEFIYNLDDGMTFLVYYTRYEGIFKRDGSHWNDSKKFRLVLRKLFLAEHEKYVNFILPPNQVR